MPDLSNIISGELIKFVIAFHLGSLIFFSMIIAPTTFNVLKEEEARKFIRSVFPKLYLWSILLNIFIFCGIFFIDNFLCMLSGLVLFGYIYSRQILVPKINLLSDQKKSKSSQKDFRKLHTFSVLIFVSQKVVLIFIFLNI